MKNLILVFLAVTAFTYTIEAQVSKPKIALESLEVSTGRTPLTSGISGSISFNKGEKNNFFFLFNNELGMVIYTRPVSKWFSVQATGGIYLNVPWAGPSISLSFFEGKIKTMNWVGWSLGSPEAGIISPEVLFNFSYQEIKYIRKGWELTYLFQNYENNRPIHLVGFIKKFRLGERFIFSAGVSYILPSEDILWSVAIKYNHKNKH